MYLTEINQGVSPARIKPALLTLILLVSACASDGGRQEAQPEIKATLNEKAYLPVSTAPPCYPRAAAQKRMEGYCIVEFTVTALGTTTQHKIVQCSDNVFASCSISAAQKFRYQPHTVNGEVVVVPGVQNKFSYNVD